ncbi:MAG: hypothetical protein R6W67_08120, partial [Bacteroidales bacterium]
MSAGAFKASSCRVPVLVLVFLLCLQTATAQETQPPDSAILIKRGSVIKSASGITVISRDSVLLVPSTLKMVTLDKGETTKAFYDSLRTRAYRGNLGRRLYDLVIVEPGSDDDNIPSRRSIEDFSLFNGYIISNINIVRLNPFGTSLMNPEPEPEGRAVRFFNNTHVRSRERLLSNYLMFAAGDTVSDLSLSETERNLRSLAFINDVRIIVLPVSEIEAEVMIITRDDYSLGADFDYKKPEKGEISLFERNLAGFGHSVEFGLPYDFDMERPWGVRMGYRVSNIARSWVDLNLFFSSTATERYHGITLTRNFVSIESKYAGGLDIREVFTTTFTDSPEISYPFEYSYQ